MAESPPPPRRRWRLSLTQTLLVSFGTLVVAGLAVALGIGLWTAWQNTEAFLRDRATYSIETLRREVEAYMKPAERSLDLIANSLAAGQIDLDRPTEIAALLRGAIAAAPQTRSMAVAAPDGRAIAGTRASDETIAVERFEWGDDAIFREVVGLAPTLVRGAWRGPAWRAVVDETVLIRVQSVYRDGKLIAIISAVVHVRDLSRFVAAAGRAHVTMGDIEARGEAFILVDRRFVLAHRAMENGFASSAAAPLPALDKVGDSVLARLWDETARRPSFVRVAPPLVNYILRVDGDRHFVVWREIDGYGRPWQIGVHVGQEAFQDEVFRLVNRLVGGLGVLIIAAVAALWIGRRIARPVQRLSAAAQLVTELRVGDVKPLPPSRVRELDDQATAFNAMLRGLSWFESYVPKNLARYLMRHADQGEIVSDKRALTVMFTDIVGFSTLSETRPASEIAAFLNAHFALVVGCIEAESGTVDKYIGDSVMAFWGAPEKQKNRADHACRAALAIRDAVVADNARRAARGEAPVKMRIGIHSGEATVGNIGAPSRLNYTTIGDMVNVGTRIEQIAKTVLPAETRMVAILISEATRDDLGPGFVVESRGVHTLRGREAPMELFELVDGPRAA
jgi:class 3 adenylate cyclase